MVEPQADVGRHRTCRLRGGSRDHRGAAVRPDRGVMIALALIPSASLVGMALVSGEFGLAGQAWMRWLVDVGCVVLGSAAVFGAKRMLLRGEPATADE